MAPMGDQGRVGHPQEDLPWNLFNWEKGGSQLTEYASLWVSSKNPWRLGLWPYSVGLPGSEGRWSVASKML